MRATRLVNTSVGCRLFLVCITTLSSCARTHELRKATCVPRISEFELRHELAKDPAFALGVPPPGKVMKVELWGCGYRISIGEKSPDEFNATEFLTDAKGRVTEPVQRP